MSTRGRAQQTGARALEEKAEFEYFKIRSKLKTKGAESEEYMEFLQWLNFQKFKAEN